MILKVLIGVFLFIVILLKTQHLIRVTGDSMSPNYVDGEVLFATSFFRAKNLKAGDVMIYRPPITSHEEVEFVIKRIHHVFEDPHGNLFFYFIGDNSEVSFDSRRYGYVPKNRLVAKVIKKI